MKSITKRIFCGTFAILLCCATLVGCDIFDHGIDKLVIVSGVAIDQGEDEKYRVTAELSRIEGGALEGNVVPEVITKEGRTLSQAFAKIAQESGDQLHLGHCELIILSEDIARDGIEDIIDLWMGLPKYTPLAVVAVSRKDTAGELLKSEDEDNEDILSSESVKQIQLKKLVYQVHRELAQGDSSLLPVLPDGIALLKNGRLSEIKSAEHAPYIQLAQGEFNNASLTFYNPDVTIDFYSAKVRKKNGVLNIHLTGSSSEYQEGMEDTVRKQLTQRITQVANVDKVRVNLSIRRESRGEA